MFVEADDESIEVDFNDAIVSAPWAVGYVKKYFFAVVFVR
jgi:hypothetical protein